MTQTRIPRRRWWPRLVLIGVAVAAFGAGAVAADDGFGGFGGGGFGGGGAGGSWLAAGDDGGFHGGGGGFGGGGATGSW